LKREIAAEEESFYCDFMGPEAADPHVADGVLFWHAIQWAAARQGQISNGMLRTINPSAPKVTRVSGSAVEVYERAQSGLPAGSDGKNLVAKSFCFVVANSGHNNCSQKRTSTEKSPEICSDPTMFARQNGGETGIRTLGRLAPSTKTRSGVVFRCPRELAP